MANAAKICQDAMIEAPYATVVNKEFIGRVCFTCFSHLDRIRKCSKCKTAVYCSIDCQAIDWKTKQHKNECRLFLAASCGDVFAKNLLDSSVPRFALRVWSRMVKETETGQRDFPAYSGFPTDMKPRCIQDLQSAFEDRATQIEWEHHSVSFCDELQRLLNALAGSSLLGRMKPEQFLKAVALCKINSFEAQSTKGSTKGKPVGGALYLQASRFNHTCGIVDLHRQQEEGSNRIKLKPVDKNLEITGANIDSLTITYNDSVSWTTMETKERRKQLKESLHFLCSCPHCADINGDKMMSLALKEKCGKCNEPLCLDGGPKRTNKDKVCFGCGHIEMCTYEEADTVLGILLKLDKLGGEENLPQQADIILEFSESLLSIKNRDFFLATSAFLEQLSKQKKTDFSANKKFKDAASLVVEKFIVFMKEMGLAYTEEYREVLKMAQKVYAKMGEKEKAIKATKRYEKSVEKYL